MSAKVSMQVMIKDLEESRRKHNEVLSFLNKLNLEEGSPEGKIHRVKINIKTIDNGFESSEDLYSIFYFSDLCCDFLNLKLPEFKKYISERSSKKLKEITELTEKTFQEYISKETP